MKKSVRFIYFYISASPTDRLMDDAQEKHSFPILQSLKALLEEPIVRGVGGREGNSPQSVAVPIRCMEGKASGHVKSAFSFQPLQENCRLHNQSVLDDYVEGRSSEHVMSAFSFQPVQPIVV